MAHSISLRALATQRDPSCGVDSKDRAAKCNLSKANFQKTKAAAQAFFGSIFRR